MLLPRSSRVRRTDLPRIGAIAVLVSLGVAVGCRREPQQPRLTASSFESSYWDSVFAVQDTSVGVRRLHWGDSTTLAAVKLRFAYDRAESPEWNDQQRLPNECTNDTPGCKPDTYGAFVTIFPAKDLEDWDVDEFDRRALKGAPVAEICSEEDYPLLGIRKAPLNGDVCNDPNTLFIVHIKNGDDWAAFMKPPKAAGAVPPVLLEVERATYETDDFCVPAQGKCNKYIPAVVRFDWVRNTLAISVKCADGWCDVMHPDRFVKQNADKPGTPQSNSRERIKGWHDSQYLMVSGPRPHGPLLEVTPVDSLESISIAGFEENWRTVAYIAKPQDYKTMKDGSLMVRGGNIRRNEIQIKKIKNSSDWQWQMMYIDASNNKTYSKARPVKWTEHTLTHTPATARWRWKADDEMVWTRCDYGCCELGDQ